MLESPVGEEIVCEGVFLIHLEGSVKMAAPAPENTLPSSVLISEPSVNTRSAVGSSCASMRLYSSYADMVSNNESR